MIITAKQHGVLASALRASIEEWIASTNATSSTRQLSTLYATSTTAYAAANIRAENIARIPLRVVDGDMEPLPDHPVSKLLADQHRMGNLQLRTELTLCFWGHSLTYVKRSPNGAAIGMRWLNPHTYTPDTTEYGGLSGFIVQGPSGQSETIRPQNAIYPYGVDFDNDFDGVAPAEAAYDRAATDPETAKTVLSFMRNRAIPALLLQPAEVKGPTGGTGKEPSKEVRNKIINFFKQAAQGAQNAGRTLVLTRRWDIQQLQQKFDEIDLGHIDEGVLNAVSAAFRVPSTMIVPSGDGYATAYQADIGWVEKWLIPRAIWLAGFYSQTLLTPAERASGLKVYPNTEGLTKADAKATTEVSATRLQMGAIDLYTAQVQAGTEKPDERFRDIYMINGQPTHIDVLVAQARAETAPEEIEGAVVTPVNVDIGPLQLPPRPERSLAAFIPDRAFHELRSCLTLSRRHLSEADFSFDPQALPGHLPLLVCTLIRAGATDEETLRLGRLSYLRHEQRVTARRSYAGTASAYLRTLMELIDSAFTGIVDRAAFGELGRGEISSAFWSAYQNGLQDAGVDTEEVVEGEREFVHQLAIAERRYWTSLANELYKQVLPAVTDEPLLAPAKHAQYIDRMELWVDKGLRNMYNQGLMSARANPMLRWVLGQTVEHCRTCLAADGQVHRASLWEKHDLQPGSSTCECGGWKCDCKFEVTTDKANGRIRAIPKVRVRKSIADEVPVEAVLQQSRRNMKRYIDKENMPSEPEIINIMQELPGGISDGLNLLCSICHSKVVWDYTVSDDFWEEVAPAEFRRDVICLYCLDELASAEGLNVGEHLEDLQFVGVDKTVAFIPTQIYTYENRKA